MRREWLAIPVSSDCDQLGRDRDVRVLLAVVTKAPLKQKSVRRRNQPSVADVMKRLEKGPMLHSPTVVHLHPTRIPDNSGAAAR